MWKQFHSHFFMEYRKSFIYESLIQSYLCEVLTLVTGDLHLIDPIFMVSLAYVVLFYIHNQPTNLVYIAKFVCNICWCLLKEIDDMC